MSDRGAVIGTIKRAVDAANRVAGIIGTSCVALMMAATVVDTARRYLFGGRSRASPS